jgi:hypothetical protein
MSVCTLFMHVAEKVSGSFLEHSMTLQLLVIIMTDLQNAGGATWELATEVPDSVHLPGYH